MQPVGLVLLPYTLTVCGEELPLLANLQHTRIVIYSLCVLNVMMCSRCGLVDDARDTTARGTIASLKERTNISLPMLRS